LRAKKNESISELPDIYRYIGLLVLLFPFFATLPAPIVENIYMNNTSTGPDRYPLTEKCTPGTFRNSTQLPQFIWKPFPKDDQSFSLPIYWTHPLDEYNPNITTAIIVQHGNLRNANDYFCSALDSFQKALNDTIASSHLDPSKFIIISPQFLVDGDLCWNETYGHYKKVNVAKGEHCNHYIWTSEGWKDGKPPVNNPFQLPATLFGSSPPPPHARPIVNFTHRAHAGDAAAAEDIIEDGDDSEGLLAASSYPLLHAQQLHAQVPITKEQLFSYDVFNLIIDALAREDIFPAMRKISLFGFSAGAQTLFRYSLYPNYNQSALMSIMEYEETKKESKEVQQKQLEQAVGPLDPLLEKLPGPSAGSGANDSLPAQEDDDYADRLHHLPTAVVARVTNSPAVSSSSSSTSSPAAVTTPPPLPPDTPATSSGTSSDPLPSPATGSSGKRKKRWIEIKTVVGDMSSFFYFDARRPFSNGTDGFGIPSAEWIRPWQNDSRGRRWIDNWDKNCANYNDWRFGFDHLDGYFLHHSLHNNHFRQSLIAEFPFRNIQFLVGLNDSLNCKLFPYKPTTPLAAADIAGSPATSLRSVVPLDVPNPSSAANPTDTELLSQCNDNELATYCQAMLQGKNRLDRFLKWRDYINLFYHRVIYSNQTDFSLNNNAFFTDYFSPLTVEHLHYLRVNHIILYVRDISHDPRAMLLSGDGQCLLFDVCRDGLR
jgi:hypothetical protein